MKKSLVQIFVWLTLILVIIVAAVWLVKAANKPGELDEFASCIQASGAKFYGSFACGHCREQKALFGKSVELLPYVECSTPDAKGQLPICIEEKISSYPTWEFPDASRAKGKQTLEQLAAKTGCALPENFR